jgi:hypothetical protein
MIVAATALAACDIGYDPGMTSGCALTTRLDRPNSYVSPGCVGDPHVLLAKGTAWQLSSNSPAPSDSHCGDFPSLAYKWSTDGTTALKLIWHPGNLVEMGIVKDPCTDNAEITAAMFDPTPVLLKGLHTHDEIFVKSAAGTHHVSVAAYMTLPSGNHYTVAVVFRPTSTGDPRWNNPAPGVFFNGNSEQANTHLLLLDARYFGLPTLCSGTSCVPTAVDVDWSKILNFASTRNGWQEFATYWASTNPVASIATQVQTYDLGSRITIEHRGFRLSTQ